jgi:hypothetical protein
MKKIAATSGHSVSRADLFLGETDTGWIPDGMLAVDNFDVSSSERITLSYLMGGPVTLDSGRSS